MPLQVLDHAQDEPCTPEIQKAVDNVRMMATSDGHSSNEVQNAISKLEELVKRHGLAREVLAACLYGHPQHILPGWVRWWLQVGELIMANRKNGMRRYEGMHEIVPGLFLSGMSVLQA